MPLQDKVTVKMPLRILHLEDNANDRELVETALAREGLNCHFLRVQTRQEFESAIRKGEFDLVISDFSMPAYDGESALVATRKFRPGTPFIFLSGTIGEERAVEFLKAGVADCVLKDNLPRIGPAVRRALREAEERARRESAEAALLEQAVQLRALAARLQTSREEERLRISRELHDELGAALMAHKYGLEWIRQQLDKPATIRKQIFEKLDSLEALADTTTSRVRKICTELRPPILDDLGLAATIEWQAREFQTRTNVRCVIVELPETLNLDNQQATAVFRIFQEILTNVARHANASHVRVGLKIAEARLVLEVKDNGKGISSDKIAGGGSFGLLGMRERALLLGGEVVIHGAQGKGTTVTVFVPINLTASKNQRPGKNLNVMSGGKKLPSATSSER
jgi:two-component system, NarL family, sensor histidine kinase UhpB